MAACMLFLFTQGCSGSSIEFEDSPSKRTLMRLSALIAADQGSGSSSAVTEFSNGDNIGIFVSKSGGLVSANNMRHNVPFKYQDGALMPPAGQEIYWETQESRLNIYAYSPYSENLTSPIDYAFAVNTDQSTEESHHASDFLHATAKNLTVQSTPVALTFNHLLSRVTVKLVAGTDTSDDELSATTKQLTISGVSAEGTINLSAGVTTSSEATTSITPLSIDGLNYAAIVYPKSGIVTFTMDMGGKRYIHNTEANFKSGYSYEFELTINTYDPVQTTLSLVSIKAWGQGEKVQGELQDEEYLNSLKPIQGVTDSVFKAFLIENFDTNQDGEISYAEARAVKKMNVQEPSGYGHPYIESIEGIENFIYLEELRLNSMSLSRMGSVSTSSFKYLKKFESYARGTSHYIGGPSLQTATIFEVPALGVSYSPELVYLEVHYVGTRTLDLRECPALKTLIVRNYPTEITLKTGQVIDSMTIPEGSTITYK